MATASTLPKKPRAVSSVSGTAVAALLTCCLVAPGRIAAVAASQQVRHTRAPEPLGTETIIHRVHTVVTKAALAQGSADTTHTTGRPQAAPVQTEGILEPQEAATPSPASDPAPATEVAPEGESTTATELEAGQGDTPAEEAASETEAEAAQTQTSVPHDEPGQETERSAMPTPPVITPASEPAGTPSGTTMPEPGTVLAPACAPQAPAPQAPQLRHVWTSYLDFHGEAPSDDFLCEWDTHWFISHDITTYGRAIRELDLGDHLAINGVVVEVSQLWYGPNAIDLEDVRAQVGWDTWCFQTCIGDGNIVVVACLPVGTAPGAGGAEA